MSYKERFDASLDAMLKKPELAADPDILSNFYLGHIAMSLAAITDELHEMNEADKLREELSVARQIMNAESNRMFDSIYPKGILRMSVLIAHASIDENKKIKGGQAGDQTGKEVCIRSWYNKPWNVVIRFKDPEMAEKFAKCMEMAAANDFIGYDQNQRNTLLNKARKYNYDVSKVQEPCETDCSALVSVACMYAGVPESALTYKGNCATTSTLKRLLRGTGQVEIYTTALYTMHTEKLRRGDILLSEGHHVAGVVKGAA